MTVSNITSKATGPVLTKFDKKPSGFEGMKICSDRPGHMTNMAATPIYGKSFENLLLQTKIDSWILKLGMMQGCSGDQPLVDLDFFIWQGSVCFWVFLYFLNQKS